MGKNQNNPLCFGCLNVEKCKQNPRGEDSDGKAVCFIQRKPPLIGVHARVHYGDGGDLNGTPHLFPASRY